ncbi:MAG: L,D-transpeptidase [Solirubrobacteraceae bacterium]
MRPYVRGQKVHVWVLQGRKLLQTRWSPIRRYHGSGRFVVHVRSGVPGQIRIVAVHQPTAVMHGFTTHRVVDVVAERASFGSRGLFVKLIQQQLSRLHFYIPQTGVYDSGTGLAVDAYHRLLRWGTSQSLNGRTIKYLLHGWGAFHVRFPGQGRHAEGNLGLQLLALVDGSRVQSIYPISSGKPSTPTILGSYQIYRRVPGYLPDGMYYSDFFIRGYAIHGYDPAPDYPASHGCMRLPIVDAISAFNWLGMGDWVDTYY